MRISDWSSDVCSSDLKGRVYGMPDNLSHERAITNLMARYTFLVDDGDFAGVGKLFARGELVLNDNPPASGADAVEAFLTKSLRTYGDSTPRTHHVSSNIIIEIEGSCDADRKRTRL